MALKSLSIPVVQGRPAPRVPENVRLYAVGDIHGRADLLRDLTRQMDEDRAAHPGRHYVEIYLGDYVDRGADSAAVISHLIARQGSHGALCLSGNHEEMLLNGLEDEETFRYWLTVGGYEAMLSYLDTVPTGRETTTQLKALWDEKLPREHVSFLRGLGLYHVCGDYLFVHAGLRPGVPLAQQKREDMLWIRKLFHQHDEPFEHFVVHGHQPVREVEVRHNRMDIDTRAYESGHLTCLVLEGAEQYILST